MTAIAQALRKLERFISAESEDCALMDSERALVERARTSAFAFGRLYELHYSAILNYLYHRTLNVSAAEEISIEIPEGSAAPIEESATMNE